MDIATYVCYVYSTATVPCSEYAPLPPRVKMKCVTITCMYAVRVDKEKDDLVSQMACLATIVRPMAQRFSFFLRTTPGVHLAVTLHFIWLLLSGAEKLLTHKFPWWTLFPVGCKLGSSPLYGTTFPSLSTHTQQILFFVHSTYMRPSQHRIFCIL